MKIDLQTLEESVKNEMLLAAAEALDYDGRFSYNEKQYIAKRLSDNSIEIQFFQVMKYRMDNLSPQKQLEFSDKVKLAKESSDPANKKFQIDDILVEVTEPESGKFLIRTSLAKT